MADPATAPVTAIRGPALTFTGDVFAEGERADALRERCARSASPAGRSRISGRRQPVRPTLPPGTHIKEYGRDSLILPGFIDCHVHYPQTQIIGAYGEQLLDWLEKYTFVAEQQFADPAHARAVAEIFLDECLRNGTTTVATFCTVHAHSVDALFEAAAKRGMRVIAGKCLMDRHCPPALSDTAQRGYDESKALIDRWHGKGRALYAITPRFAPSSTPEQMELAGALWKERPGTYLQSHVAENRARSRVGARAVPRARGISRRIRSLRAVRPARHLWPWHLSDRERAGAHARERRCDRALPHFEHVSRQRAVQSEECEAGARGRCAWALPRTSARERRCRCCRPWARRTRPRSSTAIV